MIRIGFYMIRIDFYRVSTDFYMIRIDFYRVSTGFYMIRIGFYRVRIGFFYDPDRFLHRWFFLYTGGDSR